MSEMKRPVLDFADTLYPGLRDKRGSQCTPEESIVSGIAWLADNSEHGIDDAARKLIDEFRAFAQSEITQTKPQMPPPSARIVRGLEWIWSHARADFEAGAGEKGTGMFVGTTENEVDAALDYLRALCSLNASRRP